jgi:hypothetical protein
MTLRPIEPSLMGGEITGGGELARCPSMRD